MQRWNPRAKKLNFLIENYLSLNLNFVPLNFLSGTKLFFNMFENIKELSNIISNSARKLVKIPFTTILLLIEGNKIIQVRQKKNGEIVVKIKPKLLGLLPFTSKMEIVINPNDYVNFNEIKKALDKFYKK